MNHEVNQEIIECIPSFALRDYIRGHDVKLSVMQEATIVSEFAKRKKQITLFRMLKDKTESRAEKLLLSTAIMDLKQHINMESGYMKATCEVYEQYFPHEGFPLFPFLEICNLPVLFKSGDVIRHTRFHELYCVGTVPYLETGRCDFTDESYTCYPVSCPIRDQNDLALTHGHINVCEADKPSKASLDMLTRKQQKNLRRIRELIASDDYELKHFRQ